MKRLTIAALAALLMTTTAQAATTKTDGINETVLYNNSKTFWKAAHYSYDSGSADQCALGTSWTERKTIVSGWYLKFNLDIGLHWAFMKSTWRMTEGNQVASILSVDGQTWSGKARVQVQRNEVASPFDIDVGTNFLVALRKAKQLSVVFPTATNETPFIVKIDQSALAQFEACSSRLIADSGPIEEPAEQPSGDPSGDKFRGA